jgi:uncharacterized protein
LPKTTRMAHLTQLWIYPIKSLAGISVQEAKVTRRGLEHDRRWMLVDQDGVFLTQRERPQMALLEPRIKEGNLSVGHRNRPDLGTLVLNLSAQPSADAEVEIWNDVCPAHVADAQTNAWFSEALDLPCRLVYMHEASLRQVDPKYATSQDITSFSDGFPFLLSNENSLRDLNTRLPQAVEMLRFRPNLVVDGLAAWSEDELKTFRIGPAAFYSTKPCARCQVITIDPATGVGGKEPLKTLATFRTRNNKVYFGLNACWDYLQNEESEIYLKLGDQFSVDN